MSGSKQGAVLSPKVHLARLETFWVVTSWGMVPQASNEWRPCMLLNILKCKETALHYEGVSLPWHTDDLEHVHIDHTNKDSQCSSSECWQNACDLPRT